MTFQENCGVLGRLFNAQAKMPDTNNLKEEGFILAHGFSP
jgi:hypothetical protein